MEALAEHDRAEDWRVVRGLNLYRWALAVGAGALSIAGVIDTLIQVMWPSLFNAAWIGYLLLCLPTSIAAHKRIPRLAIQVYTLVIIDIAFVVMLVLSSVGVESGLGMLLIAPIAGASILVRKRMAAALAALASISLILQEVYRNLLYTQESASLTQAGILGILLFMSSGVANALAYRARRSSALAASRKSELDDMATLNERIIANMQIGLVVVDEHRRIRTLNKAARKMLELQTGGSGQALSAVAPSLSWALQAWGVSPHLPPEPFAAGKYSLLPRFTQLGARTHENTPSPVLIFLEDAHRANEQAQQMKLAALGHLTASIAHEIRNPLSAISHASQLLDESPHLNKEDQRMLDIVQRHTGRIEHIVQSVLGLSRRGKTTPTEIALKSWLQGAINDYIQGRQDAPKLIIDDIAPTLTVQCDPNQLRQICYNLWENAERHGRVPDRELTVHMRAGKLNDTTYLDIGDNGPGLRGHSLEQLLEPFFTTTNDGTGLGLYIVRELCEGNFARLSLSADQHLVPGACFRISFTAPDDADPARHPEDNHVTA